MKGRVNQASGVGVMNGEDLPSHVSLDVGGHNKVRNANHNMQIMRGIDTSRS